MKITLHLFLAFFAFVASVRSQIHLQSGQSFVYSFVPGDIPFLTVVGVLPGVPTLGSFSFAVSDLQAGDRIHYEMFENSLLEAAICSGTTESSPSLFPCQRALAWED